MKYVIILMIKKMVKNNKILYFIIFKHKNLSLTNSFGEYKSYEPNGELWNKCNYINGIEKS
jgi:antitoxin component YwqK of YwqJK toxin-antitoxin module